MVKKRPKSWSTPTADSDSDDGGDEDEDKAGGNDGELAADNELTLEDLQDLEDEAEDHDFRAITSKLKKSPNSKARFIEVCQDSQCQKPHNIERDVPTRWNSTYKQLASIVRCEDAL
ncbi:hypothetical protein KEM48_003438 [Puccinia striiformis f. sp. tritici PST-130]|nr:hypothetical protein KEM48_003438 [Puccinia striiformis f. sp. tritici PST-130]